VAERRAGPTVRQRDSGEPASRRARCRFGGIEDGVTRKLMGGAEPKGEARRAGRKTLERMETQESIGVAGGTKGKPVTNGLTRGARP
jgi:hypothetical protein